MFLSAALDAETTSHDHHRSICSSSSSSLRLCLLSFSAFFPFLLARLHRIRHCLFLCLRLFSPSPAVLHLVLSLKPRFQNKKQKNIQTFINSFRQGDNPNMALHIITTRQIQRNPLKKQETLMKNHQITD